MSNLERFVNEQTHTYERVLQELRAGRKQSHWIWYIFPQLKGLGSSVTAQRFGISGIDEARAYLAHDVLGPRLEECTDLVHARCRWGLARVFQDPIDLIKLRSSMTLFEAAIADTDGDSLFAMVLDDGFSAIRDPLTLGWLSDND